MLYLALVSLLLAVAFAILGFGGLAGTFAWMAKILFLGFVVLAVVAGITRIAQASPA